MTGQHIITAIGKNKIDYATLLNDEHLLELYGDVNLMAGEVHKLIALNAISTEKTYSPEDGDCFNLKLTWFGLRMLER